MFMDLAKKLLFLFCVLIPLLKAMETEKKSVTSGFPKTSARALLSTPLPENIVIQSKFSNIDYQNDIRNTFNNLKITTTRDKQWHHINIGTLETLVEDQINQELLKIKQENKKLLQQLVESQKLSNATYYPKTTFLIGVLTGNIMFALCTYYAYNGKIIFCKF